MLRNLPQTSINTKPDSDFANPYEKEIYQLCETIVAKDQYILKLQEQIEIANLVIKESYSLIKSTGYQEVDGNRVMDANEYVWIDRALLLMKKYVKGML